MPELRLNDFRSHLLKAGVAPRHINRMTLELNDHFDDLYLAAVDEGLTGTDARQFALETIGDLESIAIAIGQRTELKIWSYRYPRLARACLPVIYVMLLPTTPLFAGVARAPLIARWGASMMLGALVTALILLALQLSILLT